MRFRLNQITGKLDLVLSDTDSPTFAGLTLTGNISMSAGGTVDGRDMSADWAAYAAGLTTQLLVGGGAGVQPVWTEATGTGAPVRANTPTLITPVIGVATGTSLDLGGTTLLGSRSITVDTGGVFNIDIGSAVGDDFTVDTNKFVVEGDTGKVGIGTTSPAAPLDIVATDATISLKATSASNWSGVNMYDNNGVLAASFQYANAAAAFSNSMFMGTRIANAPLIFLTGSGANERMRITAVGNVGIGTTSPTAVLHLKAGTATASTAPLKFTSGVPLTAAEAGAVEFTTDDFYATITTGAARKGILLNDGTNLTSGKIPIASTNGRLIDGQTPLAGTKVYYVADLSGGAVTRKLTFIDGILTAEI